MAVPFKGRRKGSFQRPVLPKNRINLYIKAPEVRVLDERGEMIGVMKVSEALVKSQEMGLDLVEVSPKASPPVCKIIDYGKFQYEITKKEKLQKKAAKGRETKGIRLSFRIGPGDMERQQKKAIEFLDTGHPVRIQLIMRGREKAHKNLAFDKMKSFTQSLEEHGKLDQTPRLTGFQIVAILKPLSAAEKNSQ